MTLGKDINNSAGITEYSVSIEGSDDDWAGIDVSEEASDNQKKYSKELKTCFGHRQVKTVLSRDTQKKLPVFYGAAPLNQESYSLNLARAPSKLLGLLQREISVHPRKPEGCFPTILPTIDPSGNPQEHPVHISVSDEELINNLYPSESVYVRRDSRDFFCNGTPKPEDVRQLDSRSTCYLMSTLASYASSPEGKKILKNMITPVDKNHVMVTFYDKIIGDNVQVMVSTARLVDKNGKDFYSFDNPTQACWPGIIEKAYHAYKLTRTAQLREQIKEAEDQGLIDKASFLRSNLQAIAPLKPTKSLLDWGDMSHAIGCMPGFPLMTEMPQKGAHYRHQKEAFFIQEDEFKTEKAQLKLKFNIAMGIPVILGTPPPGVKGFARTITTGSPTEHAIAVLGSASIMKKGRLEQGILVYDPYGATLDGREKQNDTSSVAPLPKSQYPQEPEISFPDDAFPEDFDGFELVEGQYPKEPETSLPDNASPEDFGGFELIDDSSSDVAGSVITKTSGRSVRFYPYDKLHKYFVKGAIAPGGYQ